MTLVTYRGDLFAQTRNLTGRRVFMQYAFGYAALNFRAGFLQSLLGGGGILAFDREHDLFDKGTNAGTTRRVHVCACSRLADAFLSRFMVGHINPLLVKVEWALKALLSEKVKNFYTDFFNPGNSDKTSSIFRFAAGLR